MSGNELFGLIGGALATSGFIPQIIRILRLKSAREISLPFTLLLLIGTICWLIYGLLQNLPAVIFWNAILLVLMAILLYTKLKYGK